MKESEQAGLTGKRAEAYDHLAALADFFHASGNEDAEDEVLDLMDVLCGWCSPHRKLRFPDEEGESDG